MNLEGNCQTTAMGIMPHRDPDKALKLALSLDIPFWPQLPRASFSEDMFAQLANGFPGAAIDYGGKRVVFDTRDFHDQIGEYSAFMEENKLFTRERDTSITFRRFIISELLIILFYFVIEKFIIIEYHFIFPGYQRYLSHHQES